MKCDYCDEIGHAIGHCHEYAKYQNRAAENKPSVPETHIAPKYYDYRHGHFAKVGKCERCGIVSLYEDFHPVKPCWRCGNVEKSWFSARWVSVGKWWQFGKGFWERAA